MSGKEMLLEPVRADGGTRKQEREDGEGRETERVNNMVKQGKKTLIFKQVRPFLSVLRCLITTFALQVFQHLGTVHCAS